MLDDRYDPDRITATSLRTYADVFREEMKEQRKVVAKVLFDEAVDRDDPNPKMVEIVGLMGFEINNGKKTPTREQLEKKL